MALATPGPAARVRREAAFQSGRQSGQGAAGFPSQTFFRFSSFCLHPLDITGSLLITALDSGPLSRTRFLRSMLSFASSALYLCSALDSLPWKSALMTWRAGLPVTINQAKRDLFQTLLKPQKPISTPRTGAVEQHMGLPVLVKDCTYLPSEHQVEQDLEIHPRNH